MKSEFGLVKELLKSIYGVNTASNTISRWVHAGRKVRGEVRTLRVARINGKLYTKPEWLRAFLEEELEAPSAVERGPTTKQLQRAQTEAEKFLASEGI
jgi:hypothetical protein